MIQNKQRTKRNYKKKSSQKLRKIKLEMRKQLSNQRRFLKSMKMERCGYKNSQNSKQWISKKKEMLLVAQIQIIKENKLKKRSMKAQSEDMKKEIKNYLKLWRDNKERIVEFLQVLLSWNLKLQEKEVIKKQRPLKEIQTDNLILKIKK